jgi:hypothetical protein
VRKSSQLAPQCLATATTHSSGCPVSAFHRQIALCIDRGDFANALCFTYLSKQPREGLVQVHSITVRPCHFARLNGPGVLEEDDALSTVFTWNSKVPTIGGQQHRYIDTSRHGVILGWAFDGTVLSHGIAKCVRAALQILPTVQASELGMLDAPRTGARNCRAQGLGRISYNGGRRRNLK